jgi:P pilus assembly chaperone PapD
MSGPGWSRWCLMQRCSLHARGRRRPSQALPGWWGIHLCIALAGWPALAGAAPDLDPGAFYRYMPAQRSTLVATLRNLGDTTAFVQLQLAELTFDAQGQAHEQPLAEKNGVDRPLLVTPPRLIIASGASQQARIIYRGPRTQERYFRVRYVPVVPKARDAFALQPDEAKAYSNALRAGVGVLKALGTLVIVGPAVPHYHTRLEPTEQRLRIVNEGTATVRVDNARYCDTNTEQCSLSTAVHIRPGQHADIERRPGAVYRFDLREGSQRVPHTYPQSG